MMTPPALQEPYGVPFTLEDSGMPAWPVRTGAAGMRDAAWALAEAIAPPPPNLCVRLTYDHNAMCITSYAVVISDGATRAVYEVERPGSWTATESAFYSEVDGSDVDAPDRVKRRLSLDRHRARIDQLFVDIGPLLKARLELLDFDVPRSKRGREKIIESDEIARLESDGCSRAEIARAIGVSPAAIRQHRRRYRPQRNRA